MVTARLLHQLPRARLAEGPFWDSETGRLLWVDIVGRAIHRYDPDTGEGATRTVPGLVGFAIPGGDGRLVAGIGGALYDLAFEGISKTAADRADKTLRQRPEKNAVYHQPGCAIRPESALELPDERLLVSPPMHAENRFNDGKCDPRGRLWAGTMHCDASREREPTGALYRWRRGTLDAVEQRISLSNGLGWSPSGDTMYFSDTHQGTVWAYDYDAASGTACNRQAFAVVPIDVGVPDGLTVDSTGRVFVAIWRGGHIAVYAPTGRLEATLPIPVRNPTSCCFGGADLQTLFVTTMPSSNEDDPRSGSLFALGLDTPGQPSIRFDESL